MKDSGEKEALLIIYLPQVKTYLPSLIDHQLTVKPRKQIISISNSSFIILDDCLYNRLNSMCSYWVCYLCIKVDRVGLNKVQVKMISNYVF